MNQTIRHQMEHRSIREFSGKRVSAAMLKSIFEVANQTATSTGMQTSSIIRVTDPAKKAALAEVCKQPYVTRTTELLIFIVDAYRNAVIAEQNNVFAESRADMDRFFQGWTDASLMAQNVTTAIESLGMGAVFFGSILNDPAAVIKILDLPKLTFPVVGVGFGWPAQEPQLKPRMPLTMKVFENSYQLPLDFEKKLKGYDKVMQTYYDLRDANKRVDSFSLQVIKKLENPIEKRGAILQAVQDQGFDLKVPASRPKKKPEKLSPFEKPAVKKAAANKPAANKGNDEFLSVISGPAKKALLAAGINTQTKLRKQSEEKLLELHGFGPKAIQQLKEAGYLS